MLKGANRSLRSSLPTRGCSDAAVGEALDDAVLPADARMFREDQIKKPRPDLAARLEREVKARWQLQIRAKAKERAASTGGIG